jgi:hypothetical protein
VQKKKAELGPRAAVCWFGGEWRGEDHERGGASGGGGKTNGGSCALGSLQEIFDEREIVWSSFGNSISPRLHMCANQ